MPQPPVSDIPCVECAHAGYVCRRRRRTVQCVRCNHYNRICSFRRDLTAKDVDVYLPELINSLEEILGRHDVRLRAIMEAHEDLLQLVDRVLREIKTLRLDLSGGNLLEAIIRGPSSVKNGADDNASDGYVSERAAGSNVSDGGGSDNGRLSPELGGEGYIRRDGDRTREEEEEDDDDGVRPESEVALVKVKGPASKKVTRNAKESDEDGQVGDHGAPRKVTGGKPKPRPRARADDADYSPSSPEAASTKVKRVGAKGVAANHDGSPAEEADEMLTKSAAKKPKPRSSGKSASGASGTPVPSSSQVKRAKASSVLGLFDDDDDVEQGDKDIKPSGSKRKRESMDVDRREKFKKKKADQREFAGGQDRIHIKKEKM
ncbi:hypothetical protein LXA43DRAFT_1097207 [Ganoderma leucocontextum]|nr:hypothetical protein LXA43DRAFT_1097207 [Ganoderma leucocontextum]